MNKIIFQIIDKDGRMNTKHIDWQSDGSPVMFELIERTIDTLSIDDTVFLILDLYSEFKEKKKSQAEKIVEEQVKAIEEKQAELWSKQ